MAPSQYSVYRARRAENKPEPEAGLVIFELLTVTTRAGDDPCHRRLPRRESTYSRTTLTVLLPLSFPVVSFT